jgi:hypothetical protein
VSHVPYPQAYRRALLDMHISDVNPKFKAKFDPVSELVVERHVPDDSVCPYHLLTYDNWARHIFPEWRTQAGIRLMACTVDVLLRPASVGALGRKSPDYQARSDPILGAGRRYPFVSSRQGEGVR